MSTITPEASTPESQQRDNTMPPAQKAGGNQRDPCPCVLIFAGSNQDSATVLRHSRTVTWRDFVHC